MRHHPTSTWNQYFAALKSKPVHPLYAHLEPHLPGSGNAIELGAGTGQGTRFLLDRGLHVIAVDAELSAIASLQELAPEATVRHETIEQLNFPPDSFDLVAAGFVLFFMDGSALDRLWRNIESWLKPGGIFLGQFLGPNDDWTAKGLTTHTREQLDQLLLGFELLHFEEVDRDGRTTEGVPKHWHVYHVIAQKR